MRRVWLTTAAVAAASFWFVVALSAQAQTAGQDAFQPVAKGQLGQETIPAARLVFSAYAFVWVALLTYVFFLWRRIDKVERDLAEVNSQLQAKRR